MNSKTKKIAFLGLATAVAIVLSYLEALMPSFFPAVPGVKIGLPNIMIIFLLYKFSLKDAVIVSIIRIFVVALLFGKITVKEIKNYVRKNTEKDICEEGGAKREDAGVGKQDNCIGGDHCEG